MRYTGQRHQPETMLYDYNARWYDAYINRWVQPDTVIPDPGDPQSLNRYAYVNNNPLKYTDSSGHCPAPPEEMGATICIALFIKPKTIMGFVHGDNRDFDSDSDPGQSRGYLWIPLDDQNAVAGINFSGYLEGFGEDGNALFYAAPSEENSWSITVGDDGEISVTYDLVISGLLNMVGAPHLNGTITLKPNEEGGYDYSMKRDGFPWAEAYYHDGEGNVLTIFQDPAAEGNPYDLYAIEPNQNGWSSFIQRSQSLLFQRRPHLNSYPRIGGYIP